MPLLIEPNGRWHEQFCQASREWLNQINQQERLILGLRYRYRMSQRDVAKILEIHEGTLSRQTTQLRDRCLEWVTRQMIAEGWTGDGLDEFIQNEMGNLLMEDPRLAADKLAGYLADKGKSLPGNVST